MTQQEIICIMCPLGCRMNIQMEGREVVSIEGEQCKKGSTYARQELLSPGRTLTTTVKTTDKASPLLPVRSNRALPKDRLDECMAEIARYEFKQPVEIGEVLIGDILGLGVDIIACRSS